MRNKLLAFAIFFCTGNQLQAQDFRIDNFHENLTDLTAAMAGVKDRNQKDAALLRFAVRDNKFELEPNLGILKQEDMTGEIRLFVPEGTKRITIRHPLLGVLRDFTLPETVKSKVTYDAEIVITNNDYLQTLFGIGSAEPPSVTKIEPVEQPVEEPQKEEPVMDEPIMTIEPLKSQNADNEVTNRSGFLTDLKIYAGLGFNALSTMGPSIHLGVAYKPFRLEAGFVVGIDKVEGINFKLSGQSPISETYDYSSNKLWLRLGYNASKDSKFKVIPQFGVSYNMISGKSKANSSTSYFKTSNSTSLYGAIRLSYEVIKGLNVHLTPQYDFPISSGDVFSFIKKADSKIKSWGEGFGVNAGVIYQF